MVSFCRMVEWLGLGDTLKTIQFQHPGISSGSTDGTPSNRPFSGNFPAASSLLFCSGWHVFLMQLLWPAGNLQACQAEGPVNTAKQWPYLVHQCWRQSSSGSKNLGFSPVGFKAQQAVTLIGSFILWALLFHTVFLFCIFFLNFFFSLELLKLQHTKQNVVSPFYVSTKPLLEMVFTEARPALTCLNPTPFQCPWGVALLENSASHWVWYSSVASQNKAQPHS